MTKSRKSKILALALCAGVMSGIYASPALAAIEIPVTDGSVTITREDLHDQKEGQAVTITGIASQDAIDKVDEKVDGMKDTVDKINEAYENGDLKKAKMARMAKTVKMALMVKMERLLPVANIMYKMVQV